MSTHEDTSSIATTSPEVIARVPWHIYILFGLVGLGMIVVISVGFYKVARITSTHLPVEHSSMKVMLDVTAAHLWLEEYLSGDASENTDIVWRRLDHAERLTEAMLTGGQQVKATFQSPQWVQARRNLQLLQTALADFRRVATDRVAARGESGPGSAADKRLDAIYAELMNLAHEIELGNDREIESQSAAFRSTQTALIVACVALTLVAGLVFRGFDRRRIAAMATIRSTTESLETEVAERQHVERSLLQTQYAIDNASEPIYWVKPDARVSYANVAACKALGYTQDEISSLHIPDFDPDVTWERWPGRWQEMKRAGSMMFDSHHRRRDGSVFPVEITTNHVESIHEEYVWAYVRDTTELERARLERARMVMAIEQAAEMILITDAEGAIQYANPAFERITGFPRDEILGKTSRILKSGKHDTRFYEEMWAQINSGKVWSGHMINKRKDGSLYQEFGTISPMFDESGSIINFVAVRRDMTREVELETQLRQAKKMEAIGLFASGVAHDFGNLLAAINGYTSLARSALPADHKVAELLAGIQRAADQGESVTQSLLTFNCKAPTIKRSVDMHDQLEHVRQLLERVLPKNITVASGSRDQAHLWVSADDSQIQRVIMNLALNARDAMPNGGTLTLSVSRGVGSENGPNPGVPVARLAVRDTGVGMTPEVRERIFDPFFTTKPKGHGTGLGLAIIHGIVKEHGGQVIVSSESGRGSTFRVELPLIAEDIAPNEMDRQALEPPGTGPLVVLADKNPQLRGVLGTLLETEGHSVIQVGDGIGLADCADLNGARIVLYILDNDLPRMSGLEFLGRLRAHGDSTPAILLTRMADMGIERPVDDRTSIVTKPYEVADLTRLVRTHLAPSAEPRA